MGVLIIRALLFVFSQRISDFVNCHDNRKVSSHEALLEFTLYAERVYCIKLGHSLKGGCLESRKVCNGPLFKHVCVCLILIIAGVTIQLYVKPRP